MTQTIQTRVVEQKIDEIFASVNQCHLPGAAVTIAVDGVPVYRKGFGRASIELPTLLTTSTRMRLASTSKHFTCFTYMLLCEAGLAGIDDEIGKYVPGLTPVNARATMRQLMSHTSGIRDIISLSMMFHGMGRPISDSDMIAYYQTIDDVDFEPGTRWSYNNSAYSLLTAAIEKIEGKPLEQVMRERVFAPIGMHDTLLRRWDTDFVPNSATMHFRDATGAFSDKKAGNELSGMGGVHATMDDMLIWLKNMGAPVVGSAETWRLMREPQRLRSGHSTGYGLGLITERYRGVETVSHAGGALGCNMQMIKVPAANLDICIAVNRNDFLSMTAAQAVIDACVEGLDPRPEPGAFEKRTGSFLSPKDGRVVSLSTANDMQFVSIDGAPPMPYTPDSAGVLQMPAATAFLQQSVRIDGDAIVVKEFGAEDRLTALQTDPEAKLSTRTGIYRSDAMDVTLELIEVDGKQRVVTSGRHGSTHHVLTPITANLWRMEQTPIPFVTSIVTLDADGRGLSVDMGRMRHVRLRKIG